ncbi:MAG: hypothetical protein NZ480_04040 [Bdellovibrionaceae bacterium]|nr:hypothetical protein [Pseudobdellovibrionaceae bacterium]MDW8191161.1 transcription termination/antitermination NusG family protein [Pseudobdellovibrionaceae bacterium]
MKNDWLLVQSKPRQEERAIINLNRQGFETFCPIVTYKKWYRGQYLLKDEYLFPRYIFIRVLSISPGSWSKIKYTYGISWIVQFGNVPVTASDDLIWRLKKQVEDLNQKPQALFQPGQKVVIKNYGLQDLEAIFYMVKGEDRAIVLINFLQRQIPTVVHISQIAVTP